MATSYDSYMGWQRCGAEVKLEGWEGNNTTQEIRDIYFAEGLSSSYMSGFRVFNKRTDVHTFREGAAPSTIFTLWGLDEEADHPG